MYGLLQTATRHVKMSEKLRCIKFYQF